MKLALQGTTAVFSSGDYGVATYSNAYNHSDGCLTSPVTGTPTIFSPSTWVDCPYILSVGATTIKANVSGYSNDPEMAVYAQFTGE